VSDVRPVTFIAEVSSNHARDLERCLKFVETAAAIGCDAVKFQLFRLEELFAPEILTRSETHRRRKAWELPTEFLPAIAEECRRQNVAFVCTPFSLQAVADLEPYVAFYKIASYELTWPALIKACAETGKPLVLSTGMATPDEIAAAVEIFRRAGGADLTLLHCVSGYPTPCQDANLAAIETLRRDHHCPVGWSDHSVNAGVVHRAIHRWGAKIIEFHLDLDGQGDEFSTGHCWLPDAIGRVIAEVYDGFTADGSGVKSPMPAEIADRDWRADPSDGLRPFKLLRATWTPAG
jgi:N-acetylneuraminate synthase